jgi:hypothetical protein
VEKWFLLDKAEQFWVMLADIADVILRFLVLLGSYSWNIKEKNAVATNIDIIVLFLRQSS